MSIPVSNIIRSVTRKQGDSLNILWFPYDGIFDSIFCSNIQHKYYGANDIAEFPSWNTKLFPLPPNFYVLEAHNSFSMTTDFDLVVCHNRFTQFDKAKILSSTLHIPLLLIEHHTPTDVIKLEDIFILKNDKKPSMCAVCNQIINKTWYSSYDIIPYGIPNLYKNNERKNQILVVGHIIKENDLQLLQHIVTHSTLPVKILNSAKPEYNNDILIEALQTSKYYLNVNIDGITSLPMLLAMSAGCVPISNRNIQTDNIVGDAKGYLFDNLDDLLHRISCLEQDNIQYIPENINKIIMEQFSLEKFIISWNQILNQVYTHIYTRQ